jgi:hypothetical protein
MRPSGFWKTQLSAFVEKYFWITCLCLVGIASARIVSTYGALSLTVDEPDHLACGLEYVAKHVYSLETQHPPLSRAMQALGPYLAGARPQGFHNMDDEGRAIIARSGNIDRTIFLMRLGNLPFFLLACLVVCLWSLHTFGRPTAIIATGLFALLPTILADGALATTDMALGATTAAAFFTAVLWAEKPTWPRGLLLGLCSALACLSKFTAIGYLPAAGAFGLLLYLAVARPSWNELLKLGQQRAATFALAAALGGLTIWAGYYFSFGKIAGRSISLPAPEFFDGIRNALNHNRHGHEAFLLGQVRTMGWWYYFPIALAVKTPIAFLLLSALGTLTCLRESARPGRLLPLAFSFGILLPAMGSHVDIGIRHIEPIYLGLSIIAAVGFMQLLQWARVTVLSALIAGLLVAWMAYSGAACHPDYLAYFNGFAGKNPEEVLVDSNYDWGQSLKLLARWLGQRGIRQISLASLNGAMRPDYLQAWYGLPQISKVDSCIPSPGWTVVSPTYAKAFRFHLYGLDMQKPWYEKVAPDDQVGPLRLYHISSTAAVVNTCK